MPKSNLNNSQLLYILLEASISLGRRSESRRKRFRAARRCLQRWGPLEGCPHLLSRSPCPRHLLHTFEYLQWSCLFFFECIVTDTHFEWGLGALFSAVVNLLSLERYNRWKLVQTPRIWYFYHSNTIPDSVVPHPVTIPCWPGKEFVCVWFVERQIGFTDSIE